MHWCQHSNDQQNLIRCALLAQGQTIIHGLGIRFLFNRLAICFVSGFSVFSSATFSYPIQVFFVGCHTLEDS